MIVDFDMGGVLIPGLLVLAIVALIGTIAVLRLLLMTNIYRMFAYRPLIEIATFVIIYGLLLLNPPGTGLLP